jgi:hypothetical protein
LRAKLKLVIRLVIAYREGRQKFVLSFDYEKVLGIDKKELGKN